LWPWCSRASFLVAIGIAAGSALSLWASQFVGALIHGLSPREPVTLVVAAVLLCSTSALAG
jgi:hypothetical protein